jgi:putative glutamine amidotransferase
VSRPLIGITIAPTEAGSPFLQQRATYPHCVEVAGGLPVLIPPMADEALVALLDRLDGLVFPGGADVDPSLYDEARHPKTEVNADLDRLELAAARWAVGSDKPVLGICRGQQLLNVVMGGSLVQHVENHRQHGDRTALTQTLTVAPDSRLHQVFGSERIDVNTMHHQAVGRLGRGLRAVAWSEDGTIEAVESDAHPWMLMVQYHPEELVPSHTPSMALITAFVEACRARVSSGPPASVR